MLYAIKGGHVHVDPDDVQLISPYWWGVMKDGRQRYARGKTKIDGVWRHALMHRLIMNARVDEKVDHVNGDGLDNRRSNLRVATQRQNAQNRQRQVGTELKGITAQVSHGRKTGRWRAQIAIDGRKVSLGVYETAEEAALAYDRKAREAFGEFARPNFPG